jgi:hypothetical protein
VSAMRQALDNNPVSEPPSFDDVLNVLGDITEGAKAQSRGEHTVKVRPSSGRRRRK